ncbi:SRPBCC family protein [Umezawaea beigongshangensis]|uniref:SRPBCC family protein n=1 Tax=Umezawaea beigongshangensis TaxID=2780383 RepID=UPI0018F1A0D5|nr:SRPBCC family protein [Umezawaea beigongshangensis]
MTTTSKNETTIEVDPALPTLRIVREFDAPASRVYRAHTDPELVARWLGPRSIVHRVDSWDARTGGSYRFSAWRDGERVAAFYGSFHEARPNERLVQTFTYEGVPDGVSLETLTFTDLGDGRSRMTSLAVVDSMEARDAMVASGMAVGVVEGYEKLDELLAEG